MTINLLPKHILSKVLGLVDERSRDSTVRVSKEWLDATRDARHLDWQDIADSPGRWSTSVLPLPSELVASGCTHPRWEILLKEFPHVEAGLLRDFYHCAAERQSLGRLGRRYIRGPWPQRSAMAVLARPDVFGDMNGYGLRLDGTSDFYEGTLRHGRPHGQGVSLRAGRCYSGTFVNGLPHGAGWCRSRDGSIYRGTFFYGQKQGHGEQVWPNGRRYVGEFVNSQPQGRGTDVAPDGTRITCEFFAGCRLKRAASPDVPNSRQQRDNV